MDKENNKLPEGWSETKISENQYLTYIPQEQLDDWKIKLWKKDNVTKILKKDGFIIKPDGRSGTIYHVKKERLCEIYFEISGTREFDILIYFDSLKEWSSPNKTEMSISEKKDIREELIVWLKKEKIKFEL
ncbi:hypothetical protein [Flavobacterium sp. GCM10023249]|uniref:hypothetical protein n=1 Tax=unclassified Flavobacterium TaxID=196869 RepID=UPI0036173C74